MQVSAQHRHAGISAQKARLIADQVRGMSAEKASVMLRFSPKKAAALVKKVIDSAIANAEHNLAADIEELIISSICIGEASGAKRFRARARGRGNRIIKRRCHIKVTVSDSEN